MPPGGWRPRSTAPGANWGQPRPPTPEELAAQQAAQAQQPVQPTGPEIPTAIQPMKPAPVVDRPRPQARPMQREEPKVRPGDLVCAQCGTGNDPARKFCRHCGASLVLAEVQAPLTWWQRVKAWFKGRPPPKGKEKVGRAKRGTGKKVAGVGKKIFAGALAVLLLMFGVLPVIQTFAPSFKVPGSDWAHRQYAGVAKKVKNVIHPRLDPIHAVGITSTSADPSHPAALAIDTYRNTFWLPAVVGADGHGIGQSLLLTFDRKVTIRQIIVTPGINVNEGDFLKNPTPNDIELIYNCDNAHPEDITVKDQAKGEANRLSNAKNVRTLTVTIKSINPHQGPGQVAAITEIELFGDPGVAPTTTTSTTLPGHVPEPPPPPPTACGVPFPAPVTTSTTAARAIGGPAQPASPTSAPPAP